MAVKFPTTGQVLSILEELEDRDESKFAELSYENIITMTDNAVLFRFHPREFIATKSTGYLTDIWFPIRALRQLEGSIYFQISTAKTKELRA